MILAQFKLICSLMGNFGACNKLTTGLKHDLSKVLYESSLLREYKIIRE